MKINWLNDVKSLILKKLDIFFLFYKNFYYNKSTLQDITMYI